MKLEQDFSAQTAPKDLQTARIVAAGASPSLAVALADLFFPTAERDDLTSLATVTASRCSAVVGSAARG